MKRFTRALVIASMCLALCACGGSDSKSVLASLTIVPFDPAIPQGQSQQLFVVGRYGDSRTLDLTSMVAWQSQAPDVALVDSSGIVTGMNQGHATISASYWSGARRYNARVTTTITPPAVRSITISPVPAMTGIDLDLQLEATATYTDGSSAVVSNVGMWRSESPSVAAIDADTGLVTGNTLGSSLISVSLHGVTTSMPVRVMTNEWSPGGLLAEGRVGPKAALLDNGKVLLVGGCCEGQRAAKAEIYDFTTRSWSSGGMLDILPFYGGTATILMNGRVLVVGGVNTDNSPIFFATGELYDPTTNSWAPTGRMATPRSGLSATRLLNGKVLVAGGFHIDLGSIPGPRSVTLASCEIYDPQTENWTPTGDLIAPSAGHTATLLRDGRVLVVGRGDLVEIYDPASGVWYATGSLSIDRAGHTATLLPDGRVLVVGGLWSSTSAEIYDPVSGTWSTTSSPRIGRSNHTATLLPNGTVLVVGGATNTSETFDPATSTWSIGPKLATGRSSHSATLLPNGAVMIAGGSSSDPDDPARSTELYW